MHNRYRRLTLEAIILIQTRADRSNQSMNYTSMTWNITTRSMLVGRRREISGHTCEDDLGLQSKCTARGHIESACNLRFDLNTFHSNNITSIPRPSTPPYLNEEAVLKIAKLELLIQSTVDGLIWRFREFQHLNEVAA